MDSRGILIIVLICCFIFQVALISGRATDTPEKDNLYNCPQLTDTKLKDLYFLGSQGTYIVLVKHVKPIEFLPYGTIPTEERNNPIYYQGKVYVFTGLVSGEIEVPKKELNPIKEAVASIAALASTDGSQMDVAIRNPLQSPETGKEIAPGGLIYFERLRKIDYLYAGNVDLFWTVFDIITLRGGKLIEKAIKGLTSKDFIKNIYKLVGDLKTNRIASLIRTPSEKLKTLSLILRKDIDKLSASQLVMLYSDIDDAYKKVSTMPMRLDMLKSAGSFKDAKKVIENIEKQGVLEPHDIETLKKFLDENEGKFFKEIEINGKKLKLEDVINEILNKYKFNEKAEMFDNLKRMISQTFARKMLYDIDELDEIIRKSFNDVTKRLPDKLEEETLKKELRQAIVDSGILDKYSNWYKNIDKAFTEGKIKQALNNLPKDDDFAKLYNLIEEKYKEALKRHNFNEEIAKEVINKLKEKKVLKIFFGSSLLEFMKYSGIGRLSYSELKRLAILPEKERINKLKNLYNKYIESLEKALSESKDTLIAAGIKDEEISNLLVQIKSIKGKIDPKVEKHLEKISKNIESSWKTIDKYAEQLHNLNTKLNDRINELFAKTGNKLSGEERYVKDLILIGHFNKLKDFLKTKGINIEDKEIKKILKDIEKLYNKRYDTIIALSKEYQKAPGIWDIAAIANIKVLSKISTRSSKLNKLLYVLIPPYPAYKGFEKVIEKWENYVKTHDVSWKVAYGVPLIMYFAVRDVEYWLKKYFAVQSIEKAYTMSYFATLSSSNNQRLILMSNQQYYSKWTAEKLRSIPIIGKWWDSLAKTCHEFQTFTVIPYKTYGSISENIRDLIHTWLVNLPGFVYPTELLYHYVPYRYTILIARGEIAMSYETREIKLHSSEATFVSRGGEVLNEQMVELSPELKLSYVYTNPIKIINTNSYRISEEGLEHLKQVIKNNFNTNDIGAITYINPAQAIALTNLESNSKYYIEDNEIFDMLKLFLSGVIFGPAYELYLFSEVLSSDWEIENVIITSEYGNPCKLSMKDRINYNCIATVYNILLNIEKDKKVAYKKAVNFCNQTSNNAFVNSILKFMGVSGDTYYPVTLDWYLYCPANYIYVKGRISGAIKIEEIGKVSNEFLKVCGWVK